MKKKCYCGCKDFKNIEIKVEQMEFGYPYDDGLESLDAKICKKCGLIFCTDTSIVRS